MMLYLSRAFVEFGPFAAEEMLSFNQRGLLKDTDYLRAEGSDHWVHVSEWSPTPSAPIAAKASPAKKKAKAAPVAKKAPAKKAKKLS